MRALRLSKKDLEVIRTKAEVIFYTEIQHKYPNLWFDYSGEIQKLGDTVRMISLDRPDVYLQITQGMLFILPTPVYSLESTSLLWRDIADCVKQFPPISPKANYFSGHMMSCSYARNELHLVFIWGTHK